VPDVLVSLRGGVPATAGVVPGRILRNGSEKGSLAADACYFPGFVPGPWTTLEACLADETPSKEQILESATLEAWGIVLGEPTTTFTDLALALESWILFRRMHPTGLPRWFPEGWPGDPATRSSQAGAWSAFFFFLSIATLLGAAKHGIPHYLAGMPLSLTVFGSSLAAGLAILNAEAATVASHARTAAARRWLKNAALGKFALFVLVIAFSGSFLVVVVNSAIGLGPVMLVAFGAFRRGHPGSGWVAAGLALSLLAACTYVVGIPSHPWFGAADLAHVLMMGTLLMISRGVRRSPEHGGPSWASGYPDAWMETPSGSAGTGPLR